MLCQQYLAIYYLRLDNIKLLIMQIVCGTQTKLATIFFICLRVTIMPLNALNGFGPDYENFLKKTTTEET